MLTALLALIWQIEQSVHQGNKAEAFMYIDQLRKYVRANVPDESVKFDPKI